MTKGAIRAERRVRSDRRKRRRRMFIYAGAIIVAAAFIASLLVPGGLSSRGNIAHSANRINSGGPVPILPDEGRGHIAAGERWSGYKTKPATSGPHWGTLPVAEAPDGAPVRWGIYDHVIADEALVHNLEHGGISLHYNCPEGCPQLVEQLKAIPSGGVSQFVLSPYPNMDSKIAIVSWRHLLKLEEFDEAKIREFIDAYQDRAPESFTGNQF
ncbi:MAG: DUF3105 domain-containing protein [Chloroflexi bacterium]|nr:DUF3105 domain-containing protein [Chloroflexota bacterium]